MKIGNFLFLALAAGSLSFATSGCSKKCKGEDPRARITNNGTQKASVQVKTSGGNTVNINNVDPGTSSDYSNYSPGQVTFTITVSNVNYVKTTDVNTCFQYDIIIDRANVITVNGTDRNN